MVHPNNAILQSLKDEMGDEAQLLEFLPLDAVRMVRLPIDKKPASALPYMLHFGEISNGTRLNATKIGVVLCIRPLNGNPKKSNKRLCRLRNITGSISAQEAARQVSPAFAFQAMKHHGSMDSAQFRAVIRCYFIAMRVDLPSSWPVDQVFVKDLTAACNKKIKGGGVSLTRHITGESGANPAVQADA